MSAAINGSVTADHSRSPQSTLCYMGTQRNTVGSLFICALLHNFGLTLPFRGVITGAFYNVSACNAHKVRIIHVS